MGFDCLDRIVGETGSRWKKPWFRPVHVVASPDLVCVKPLTYMNRCGQVFPWILSRYGVERDRLCVVVDNMDLPPGEIRMKRRGGPAGHNGLKSIGEVLNTDEYPRLYIGIGRPHSEVSTVEHVLGRFDQTHRFLVDEALDRIVPVFAKAAEYSTEQLITAINDRRRPSETSGRRTNL